MILCFTLSMPGAASWNGRWSGEGKLYALTRRFSSKKAKAKAEELKSKGHFTYSWSDGWRAAIDVRQVTPGEANRIRRQSKGFCGYDWMVESILSYGKILNDAQKQEVA